MPVQRLLDIETCHSRFTLAVSPNPDGLSHTARYWNLPGRLNKLGRHLKEQHYSQVSNASQEGALAMALVQIEGLDGPLLDVAEQDLHMDFRLERSAA